MQTVNKQLATSPPVVDKLADNKSSGGLVLPTHKTSLMELTLVYAYDFNGKTLNKGSKIYVSGELAGMECGRKIYTLGQDRFVLIPESYLVAVSE